MSRIIYNIKEALKWLTGNETVYEPNPLQKNRNMICICGTGLKAKRCCGLIDFLPADVAKAVRRAIKYEKRRASA